jgi:hypothetical protein
MLHVLCSLYINANPLPGINVGSAIADNCSPTKQSQWHTSSSMAKAAGLAPLLSSLIWYVFPFFPASCFSQALYINANPHPPALMMSDSDNDGSPTAMAAPAAHEGSGDGTSNSGCSGDHAMVRAAVAPMRWWHWQQHDSDSSTTSEMTVTPGPAAT